MTHNFDVSISVDKESGAIIAVYFEFLKGKAAETREYANGSTLADYDSKGRLLGIELLAPCKSSDLRRIKGAEPTLRKFVKESAPRKMVRAG